MTVMRVAKLAVDGRESFALVRNISAGGMRIDTPHALAIGQAVTVSLFDGQQLGGTIVWRTDDSVGLRFDELAPVETLLAFNEARNRVVRAPRVAVFLPARLRPLQGVARMVTLADLSQRGARILTDAGLKMNQHVILELEGLPALEGTVRWVGDGSAGVAFHNLIGARALMAWFAAQGST